ncbi:MAG: DUF2085 domain-containing protein [Chloroflexi bacterium]|nr:DUF2085 domain-containing protein [Chloroflexota bacterium]
MRRKHSALSYQPLALSSERSDLTQHSGLSTQHFPLARHWLALANAAVGLFVALSFAAPALMAAGFTGAADLLYDLYAYTCHQWPFRSFFLFGPQPTYSFDTLAGLVGERQTYSLVGSLELGYKMAFCERDLAIYATILLGGLAFGLLRARARPLGFAAYLVLCLPIALDGFTQLFGWRESTWELRLLTGALFGLASVWLIYPRVDRALGFWILDFGFWIEDAGSGPFSIQNPKSKIQNPDVTCALNPTSNLQPPTP